VEGNRVKQMGPLGSSILALVVVALGQPLPAEAHLNSTGMGPVYDGLLHFVLSPDDLVPALALALLAGLRGVSHGQRVLLVLPAAWLVGAALGMVAPAATGTGAGTAIWFVLLGVLVAADVGLSLRVTTGLAALLGLDHGFMNGGGMGGPGDAIIAVLAVSGAVFVLVALAAALVVRLRAHWARLAVRVAGSWIAASGLLMLGWAVRAR
jgi:hydrogenase/urease accessory protein HupE